MKVVALGDLVLDVVVLVDSAVARGADTPARVSLSTGGQAANVAAWVSVLGGSARWLQAGRRMPSDSQERLEALGVELTGPSSAPATA
jgi:sugar/nucleoside kinase (ribokinase family)